MLTFYPVPIFPLSPNNLLYSWRSICKQSFVLNNLGSHSQVFHKMSKSQLIYYIHGFNSSPQSKKANILKEYFAAKGMAERYRVPALPYAFNEAIDLLEEEFKHCEADDVVLIGSSLGGFYSTYFAERYGFKAALINPAVDAHILLASLIGENENIYTGEKYTLTQTHIDALAAVNVSEIIKKELFLVLVQTEDETLDYRKAVHLYDGCHLDVEEGGSHSYENFEQRIPQILEFLCN